MDLFTIYNDRGIHNLNITVISGTALWKWSHREGYDGISFGFSELSSNDVIANNNEEQESKEGNSTSESHQTVWFHYSSQSQRMSSRESQCTWSVQSCHIHRKTVSEMKETMGNWQKNIKNELWKTDLDASSLHEWIERVESIQYSKAYWSTCLSENICLPVWG